MQSVDFNKCPKAIRTFARYAGEKLPTCEKHVGPGYWSGTGKDVATSACHGMILVTHAGVRDTWTECGNEWTLTSTNHG